MLTKSILAGAAFALAATTGAASAADPAAAGPALAMPGPFSVLAGVPATPLGALELSVTRGALILVIPQGRVIALPRLGFFANTHSIAGDVGGMGPPTGT